MNARPSLTRYRKSKKGYITTLVFTITLLTLLTTDINPSTIIIKDWKMQDLVKVIAIKNNLNPHLVLSIIHTESKGFQHAVSGKGAIGLMQVMPAWIPQLSHLDIHSRKDLLDPEKNIAAGCYVLKQHLREESHSLPKALNAYSGQAKGYVKKVLVNYVKLEERYEQSWKAPAAQK